MADFIRENYLGIEFEIKLQIFKAKGILSDNLHPVNRNLPRCNVWDSVIQTEFDMRFTLALI